MHANLIPIDRAAKFSLQHQHFDGMGVHRYVKYLVASFTVCLGSVHSNVRITQNVFWTSIACLRKGNADAGCREKLMSIEVERAHQLFLNPLRDMDCIVRILDTI